MKTFSTFEEIQRTEKAILVKTNVEELNQSPEEIYRPLGLTRATFYRYAKILDNHTNEEIKKMAINKNK